MRIRTPCPTGWPRKPPRMRGRLPAARMVFGPFGGICGEAPKTVRFAGSGVACPTPARFACARPLVESWGEVGEVGSTERWGTEGELRRLLLRSQRTVRSRTRRAVRDLSPRPSRGPAAAEPAALRVPPGAPPPGRVGVSYGAGAGGAARLKPPHRARSQVAQREVGGHEQHRHERGGRADAQEVHETDRLPRAGGEAGRGDVGRGGDQRRVAAEA